MPAAGHARGCPAAVETCRGMHDHLPALAVTVRNRGGDGVRHRNSWATSGNMRRSVRVCTSLRGRTSLRGPKSRDGKRPCRSVDPVSGEKCRSMTAGRMISLNEECQSDVDIVPCHTESTSCPACPSLSPVSSAACGAQLPEGRASGGRNTLGEKGHTRSRKRVCQTTPESASPAKVYRTPAIAPLTARAHPAIRVGAFVCPFPRQVAAVYEHSDDSGTHPKIVGLFNTSSRSRHRPHPGRTRPHAAELATDPPGSARRHQLVG